MHIFNLLNTNTTTPNGLQEKKNNIEPTQLLRLLNNTGNKTSNKRNEFYSNPEYLGQGINGDLFKVEETESNQNFICKVIVFNKDYLKQLKRELGLLKTIQEHEIISEYINPCKKIFIRDNSIISLFPVFNGITLTNIIKLLNTPDFDKNNKLLIIKYIIKEILEAIDFFHDLNVSHLQLDTESILIELKEPKDSNLSKNSFKPKYSNMYDNENIPIRGKDKFVPTNMKIYTAELSPNEKPLQIKFTNFGIGCGKLTEYDIVNGNKKEGNVFQQCNIIKFDKDPYMREHIRKTVNRNNITNALSTLKNSDQFEIAKLYDCWLIGLIILQLLLKPDVYSTFDKHNQDNQYASVVDLISNLDTDDLVDESLELYMDNLKQYVLCPIKNRKNLKFVQEMIILDEKHD